MQRSFVSFEGSTVMEFKVEKILKGSLDSISSPSPSVKIQIMGGKVCLRCKGKTLLGVVNKLLKIKKFVDITQQCFALLSQVNFPANNLNYGYGVCYCSRNYYQASLEKSDNREK